MGYNTNLIGNYIHYRYDNYKKLGLRKSDASGSVVKNNTDKELNMYLAESKAELKKMINANTTATRMKKIQDRINRFQNANKKIKSNPQQELDKADQELTNIIFTIFKDLQSNLSAEDFDLSTFQLTNAAKEKLRKRKINPEKYVNLLGENDKLLKITTLLRGSLGRHSKEKVTTASAFRTQVKNLQAAVEAMNKELYSETSLQELEKYMNVLVNMANQVSGYISTTDTVYSGMSSKNELEHLNINDLIKRSARIIFAAAAVALIEGDFFEAAIAAVGQQLQSELSTSIDKIADSFVAGSDSGSSVILAENFSKSLDFNRIFSSKEQGDLLSYSIGSQKGKIDVAITNDSGKLLEGITAKSYQMDVTYKDAKNISLVGSTNLIYLFQTKAQFLNHYLNQTASGPDANSMRQSSIINQANQIMKQMILLSAIVGGGLRKNESGFKQTGMKASIFALNDKSNPGNIKLMSVESLFNLAIQNNKYTVSLQENQTWPNHWEDSVYGERRRIENILMAVHKKKISASINKDIFI